MILSQRRGISITLPPLFSLFPPKDHHLTSSPVPTENLHIPPPTSKNHEPAPPPLQPAPDRHSSPARSRAPNRRPARGSLGGVVFRDGSERAEDMSDYGVYVTIRGGAERVHEGEEA